MIRAVLCALLAAACAGTVPDTRYYQLAPPAAAARSGELVIVLEPLATEAAYEDERIVYRTGPFRLDYYQYHRWSATPGVMIAGYLEQALEGSGRVRAVVRELAAGAAAVLGGRVIAIEELDAEWRGRIILELTLADARSGAVVWSEQFSETEPLRARTPEDLARALSAAMARIAARAIPDITRAAEACVVRTPDKSDQPPDKSRREAPDKSGRRTPLAGY